MKRFLFLLFVTGLHATSSSLYWTNCSTSVLETGMGHIDEDNYFTLFFAPTNNAVFPPDTGFEVGLLSWGKWSVEVGVDVYGGTKEPLAFNAGIGIEEEALFEQAPSFKIGIYQTGIAAFNLSSDNQTIVNVIVGKSIPTGGTLYAGLFRGEKSIGPDRQGWMVGYEQEFCKRTYCDGREFNRWILVGDYASGRNSIGGGGVGVGYNFTPDVSLLTGPVWFNSSSINGDWKWTVQIGIDFKLFETAL